MSGPTWALVRAAWPPSAAAASENLRDRLAGKRTFLGYAASVVAMNTAALLGNALVFRWIDPASMGVWHTLILASSYLTVVRLGMVNGMGRELPYALGRGDVPRARRIAATSLAYNGACSALVGLAFLLALGVFWSSGAAWRVALPAMALVSASNLYLAYLQATMRSDADFGHLSRVHVLQAGTSLLLPFMVYALGFPGLCLQTVLQAVAVTGFAHSVRPLRVAARFEWSLARQLFATGLPLFVAGYLQVVATGFDRVILLQRGSVETVGYYAPAMAVLSAMSIVPGALATYVYPRMSFALGQGRARSALRRMSFTTAAVSVAAGLPLALAGWFAAPALIARFFPQYLASIPAVRWSFLSGLLWGLTAATNVLGSLKAWRSLSLYVGLVCAARWVFPWALAQTYEPLEGVARGNLWAGAFAGLLSLVLVQHATAKRTEEPA